jgi:mono/diheme cytochrome c family protein
MRTLAVVFAALVFSACQRSYPEMTAASDLAAGRAIYLARCARCHGIAGDGQTPLGKDYPYANLTDGVWRTDGSLARIEEAVRTGHRPMPGFERQLSESDIHAVAGYVRTFVPSDKTNAGGKPR